MTDIRRIIVCGSRGYQNRERVWQVLDEYVDDDPTIVTGACGTGADRFAIEAGYGLGLEVETHPAEWDKYGNAAGPIRNRYMGALGAELLIAFGEGRGTNHMVSVAESREIPVRREA